MVRLTVGAQAGAGRVRWAGARSRSLAEPAGDHHSKRSPRELAGQLRVELRPPRRSTFVRLFDGPMVADYSLCIATDVACIEGEVKMKNAAGGALLLIVVTALSGCSPAMDTVSVTGTISATFWPIKTSPILTVSSGGKSYTAILPIPSVGNPETFTFSIPWVEKGTYSLVMTFDVDSYWMGTTYTINGGSPLPVTSEGAQVSTLYPYTYTIQIDGVKIDGDTTIDLEYLYVS